LGLDDPAEYRVTAIVGELLDSFDRCLANVHAGMET
jgi:hypothetical protein